jgi:hypothetical protein
MDYYHRYNHDGSYETMCTRCFSVLGRVHERTQLRLIESAHICPARRATRAGRRSDEGARNLSSSPRRNVFATQWPIRVKGNAMHTLLLLFSAVICLYILPSAIEVVLMRRISGWVACVLFGDLIGCSVISFLCGLRKTGVLLYLLLTGCEASLYAVRILQRPLLPWIVDIGPTLTVVILIAGSFFGWPQAEG